MLELKMKKKISNAAIDDILKFHARTMNGGDNNIPPSFHSMQQVVGVDDLEKYEQHACHKCLFAFDDDLPANPDTWTAEHNKECPSCLERYLAETAGYRAKHPREDEVPTRLKWRERRQKYVVAYRYFYFGVESAIQSLSGAPVWAKGRMTKKEELGGWWAGEDAKKLNEQLGGLLFDVKNGAYEGGCDWARPYLTKDSHSSLFVFLRALDLPPVDLATRAFNRTLAYCPGKIAQTL
jgi:hypothetical protein